MERLGGCQGSKLKSGTFSGHLFGFRVLGSGFWGFGVLGFRARIFRIGKDSEFKIEGVRVEELGFRDSDS